MNAEALLVRFKGHPCTAFKCALSRKPILLRAGKNEAVVVVRVTHHDNAGREISGAKAQRLARLECARAIRRTESLRRRLNGNNMLRGTDTVERLLRDHDMTRRGKRWKICPVSMDEARKMLAYFVDPITPPQQPPTHPHDLPLAIPDQE